MSMVELNNLRLAALVVSAVLSGVATSLTAQENTPDTRDPASIDLQEEFDHIGAEVNFLMQGDRTSYYIDEGRPDDRAVVFIGGQGTSLEAFQLTEFARSSREELGLRVISVERNGFGESEFDPELGYADYVEEVLAVLDHLGVEEFAVMAISGGGAYAAHLASAVPDRVLSLHLGAAVSRTLPTRTEPDCSATPEEVDADNTQWTQNPKDWWGVPGSPVLVVPGWQTRAYADATRSFYVGGQMGDPSALSHEDMLPCSEDAVVDASRITAPAFLYWGEEDKAVPVAEMEQWQAALPNVIKATAYPGEGHTVQYRHWDQILVDMAGYHDHTVVCRDGKTLLVPSSDVGDASVGLCAWEAAQGEGAQ
jgi:pimeloyl-ACP methyl ester carboxylesterase